MNAFDQMRAAVQEARTTFSVVDGMADALIAELNKPTT